MSLPPDQSARRIVDGLNRSLAGRCDQTLSLRPEEEGDQAVARQIYADSRNDELAAVDWSVDQKQAFIEQQFSAQRHHYRQYYSGADFLMACRSGEPVGRLYLCLGREELRLMDIALLARWRRQGLGRAILSAVIELAETRSLDLTLHVEPGNPARLWYQRLGFQQVEQRGAYSFMRLPHSAMAECDLADGLQPKLIS